MATSIASQESENRRTHKKSRNGCVTCKKRHVKCDEARPKCLKCTAGNRHCSYVAAPRRRNAPATPPSETATQDTGSISSRTSSPAPAALLAALEDAPLALLAPGRFNSVHMSLFYHALTNMELYTLGESGIRPILEIALDTAATAPYLLDQLLAVAALHRSIIDEKYCSLFLHHATDLQTRALSQFNEARENINEANYMPSFLFASLLGIHVLHNTLVDHQNNIGDFISAFVDYTRVHRGVRTVTSKYWDLILKSKLAPMMDGPHITGTAAAHEHGPETAELLEQLDALDPTSPPVAASIEALKVVQWMIKHQTTSTTFNLKVQAAMPWPLIVPDAYIDALYQRRPEALAVLVFYLAVLYNVRPCWIFEGCKTGRIKALARHIGPFWDKALSWPLSVVTES